MSAPTKNLYELLEHAATEAPNRGLTIYSPGNTKVVGSSFPYHELLRIAQTNSHLIHKIPGIKPESKVIIHFNTHLDNIVWLWSVIVAGYVPVISTPFANDLEQRKRHVTHLEALLQSPVWITKQALLTDIPDFESINAHTIEQLQVEDRAKPSLLNGAAPKSNGVSNHGQGHDLGQLKHADDIAVLMLTSGSSGNSKAVCLRHGQILTAIAGKSRHHGTNNGDPLLSWIGMDHVANLTEIHLHGMFLQADQVHVQAADILVDPCSFLDLLDRHRVVYTFGPNFFLAALRRALQDTSPTVNRWDLSCLRAFISGGEANVVETCASVAAILQKFGAPANVIRPGFGMTETCAGSIYGKDCPSYDLKAKNEFACLGSCIPGMDMRVRLDSGKIAEQNEVGNLEVSGPVVFREYFNNPAATSEAFVDGKWFITGDRALIDSMGQLNLAGRAKETVIINGVNYFPHEIETSIEEASIAGMVPGHAVVFPFRSNGSETEDLGVVYLPSYAADDVETRAATSEAIARITQLHTGARPRAIVPLDAVFLQKSSLGKLSRVKIRTAFLQGKYDDFRRQNDEALDEFYQAQYEPPSNEAEAVLLEIVEGFFELLKVKIGVTTNIMDLGVNSIGIIRIKTLIERRLKLQVEIPMILVMTNPTVRTMASALERLQQPHLYDPVVVLQGRGSGTPLWMFHPGVGEILVFLQLAKYITERPVYALRARGFDGDQTFFGSIEEAVSTYHGAIKKRQPDGPYALAGYSFGTMLAFETTKVLESNGDEVRFLGSLNLPPHIKHRMRQLDWVEVLLNLSYFLDLISDTYAHDISPAMHQLTHDQVLTHLVDVAPPSRFQDLALSREKLARWTDLAHAMQAMARDYEPSGKVANMDVFYAIPLSAVAKSKSEWLEKHLSKWSEFVASPPQFYEVDGAHYTMISPEHIATFQKRLKGVLLRRGL